MIRHSKLILALILLISISLRLGASLILGDEVVILPGTADQLSYHKLAVRVHDGYGFSFAEAWWPATAAGAPTAHWSFLYTFYLIIVYSIFGIHPFAARLIQVIIAGALQPLLAYLIARRVFGNSVALVAAALTAIYAYFIYYAATLMTEPFYITAILGSLYLSIILVDRIIETNTNNYRSTVFALAIGLGLTLGITILLRQLFLLFVPFIFLWVWWSSKQKAGRWTNLALIASGLLIIALIFPFTLYNYNRFGHFVLLNTNAGYAFFWANHPVYGTSFEPILTPERGTYESLIPEELHSLDEAAMDQALLKRGLQFIIDEPGRYILLSVSRIPAYFKFWPSPDSGIVSNLSRVGSFGLLFPFMLYGLYLAVFKIGRRSAPVEIPTRDNQSVTTNNLELSSPLFLLILYALIYSIIHILSWALIRYRLPVDAVLLIFAALAIVEIAYRLGVNR